MKKELKNIQTFEQHSSELNINESKTNKDIEELLRNGSRLIAVTKYKKDKEVEVIFYVDEETTENEITEQQFEEYMMLCDNSDTSDWYLNWKIGKTGRSYYWL